VRRRKERVERRASVARGERRLVGFILYSRGKLGIWRRMEGGGGDEREMRKGERVRSLSEASVVLVQEGYC
jgi:hypothetical protein